MSEVKLVYFPVRGLLEPSRLCLHYAGIKFEDKRVTDPEWMQLKPTTPNGQLPLLHVDGRVVAQSAAILTYCSRRAGLAPADDFEAAKADEVFAFFYENLRAGVDYLLIKLGRKQGDEKAALPLFREKAAEALHTYQAILAESGSGFALPSGLSYADFVIANHSDTIAKACPELASKHPTVMSHQSKVYALPQLKSYLASRPDTIN